MSKEDSAPYSFKGDNAKLVDSIKSLLALDSKGALVPHGVCGLARQLLESAAERLSVEAQPAAYISASVLEHLMAGGDAGWQWIGPAPYGSDQIGLYTRSDAGEVDRLYALCIEKDERMAEMNKGWAAAIDQRDTAAAEAAALREELAQADNLLGETAEKQFQAEADLFDAQQRLAAAEQRNAELFDLLGDWVGQFDKTCVSGGPITGLKSRTNVLLNPGCSVDGSGRWEFVGQVTKPTELGECKGEYDRAVNKVDVLRDQLAALIPEGYCVMPRRLTAENGAKALLIGEFKVHVTQECRECAELDEPDEHCEICDGEGEYCQHHTISWDQIKFIYSKAAEGLSASAEPAQSRDLDEHDRSAQDYWADQAAQGKPYEAQLREACERNGIDHGLDDAGKEPTNKEGAQ